MALSLAVGLWWGAPGAHAQNAAPAAPAPVAEAPLAPGLRQAAETLLQVMQTEKTTAQGIDQMITMQVQQNPHLKNVEPEMRAFMTKYMSWAAIREDLVQLYAREFTEKELRSLIKFYKSATGQKYIGKQSLLLQASMEIGQRRVQENLPELKRMIEQKMTADE